jgi:hypothetical protein
MRKFVTIAAATACLTPVAVALAQTATPAPLQLEASAKVAKGGSKKKPKPVAVTSIIDTSTADGSRQETFSQLDTAFGAVRSNGKHFPKCTVAEIDEAQSDEGCPEGSLIADGDLTALVGPENDFSNPGAECKKTVHLYNAGQNKVANILVGPADECVGVGYLPPWELTWSNKGGVQGGQVLLNPIPPNISHPLPGVLGSTVHLVTRYKKLTTKVKGKTVGYLESIGCKGKRKATTKITGDPSGTKYAETAIAGAC